MDSEQTLVSKMKTLESQIKSGEERERREKVDADRIGQEIAKLQENIVSLDKKRAEAAEKARKTQEDIDKIREQLRGTERNLDQVKAEALKKAA